VGELWGKSSYSSLREAAKLRRYLHAGGDFFGGPREGGREAKIGLVGE